MQRRDFLAAAAAATTAHASWAQASPWPSQPVKLLVAFPAGGPTDITMRVLADNAAKLIGQPVVVENRAGAGDRKSTRLNSSPSRCAMSSIVRCGLVSTPVEP